MEFVIKPYDTVDSTNIVARNLADGGAPEGTVVLANEQTEGRGRKGDHWYSPRGGLWFTVILRPKTDPESALILTLLTGIAVHRTLKGYDISGRIKLPNDLMFGGKKLCGILCENSIHGDDVRYVLVGVGINVENEPPEMGVTVNQISTTSISRDELLDSFLVEFEKEYHEFSMNEYFFGEGYEV